DGPRRALAAHLAHPERRRRLLDDGSTHERKYCMPLAEVHKHALFGEGHPPADWLRLSVGEEKVHLGRPHYEGLVNPLKLARCVSLLGRSDELARHLAAVAESVTFVTEVSACEENPDFYDLTVDGHSNYLAGERGLVAIHNTGTNFSAL